MNSWTLRPALDSDHAFAESVYFETQRYLIEALFGWRGYEVERRKFAESYDPAKAVIVVVDSADAGWMSVLRFSNHLELEHLYLLPSVQRQGLGTQLIASVIEEADRARLPVRLSAATLNPALQLYRRLGFIETGADDFKTYLERPYSTPRTS